MELIAELDYRGSPDGVARRAIRLAEVYDWLDIPDSPMGVPGPHSLLASCTLSSIHGLRVIAHIRLNDLTYTGFKAVAKTLGATRIRRVVVLRGDPPRRGSRVEDLTPEEALRILKSRAPQVRVGLLLSMRKPWSMILDRLSHRPDFLLILHYRAQGVGGLERLRREASRLGVKLIPYLVLKTPRNRGVIEKLQNHSIVEPGSLVEEAQRLYDLVDGLLVSAPGDPEALEAAGHLLRRALP